MPHAMDKVEHNHFYPKQNPDDTLSDPTKFEIGTNVAFEKEYLVEVVGPSGNWYIKVASYRIKWTILPPIRVGYEVTPPSDPSKIDVRLDENRYWSFLPSHHNIGEIEIPTFLGSEVYQVVRDQH